SDIPVRRMENLKAGVSRRKIKLFLVKMVVRYMRFPVNSKEASVRVQNRRGVIEHLAVPLVKADGQHQRKLLCHRGEMPHRLVLLCRLREMVEIIPLLLAEIIPLKQLRQKNHLGSLGR